MLLTVFITIFAYQVFNIIIYVTFDEKASVLECSSMGLTKTILQFICRLFRKIKLQNFRNRYLLCDIKNSSGLNKKIYIRKKELEKFKKENPEKIEQNRIEIKIIKRGYSFNNVAHKTEIKKGKEILRKSAENR